MPFAAGTKLGPYELGSLIGSGGMGEVYRARDPRLRRDIAIKILPASFCSDPERLQRFEQEALATAALSNPNILAVYDVGHEAGAPYIVAELLDGEPLRSRMAEPLPARKAVEYALQIASGLAAAHEKGIVHRDIKPENVFITKDGRVKILDFGVAKLAESAPAGAVDTIAPTVGMTAPGTTWGTVGYMAPEQIRALPVDHRADIFALGSLLYEMLAGEPAFTGATPADTASAILTRDPPDLQPVNLSPALGRIVRRCLEKEPGERFQSARDLAFALATLSESSTSSQLGSVNVATPTRRAFALRAAVVAVGLLGVGAAYWAGTRVGGTSMPAFRQLTFRRGWIFSARFAADGQTIVYGAGWDGKPVKLFSTRVDSSESRPLDLPDGDILAISSAGDMLLSLGRRYTEVTISSGMLARASLAGGAQRDLLENVQEADWSPDRNGFAVVREVGKRYRLEYPLGTVLYETAGWISHPRVSPDGNSVAFFDHPIRGFDAGALAVVDKTKKIVRLSENWGSAEGVAWHPNGREIWFTAGPKGFSMALYAVTPDARQRLVVRVPGRLLLQDIDRGGRVLVTHTTARAGMVGLLAGDAAERDYSWLDASLPADLSRDGRMVLFNEFGEGAPARASFYLRRIGDTAAVHLGDGTAFSLSPDGRWALVSAIRSDPHDPVAADRLTIVPTGAGESRVVDTGAVAGWMWGGWFPDSRRIVFSGREAGKRARLYAQDAAGGPVQPLTPEGVGASAYESPVSPDGKWIAAIGPDGVLGIYSTSGEPPRPIPDMKPGFFPITWTEDSRTLFISHGWQGPAKVYRLDVASGRRELWKELMPADPTGIIGMGTIKVSADGRSYVYAYARYQSDLYVVDGLK